MTNHCLLDNDALLNRLVLIIEDTALAADDYEVHFNYSKYREYHDVLKEIKERMK